MNQERYRGLSHEQVLKSREEHGINIITPAKRKSVWKMFFEKFNDPIIKVLLIAAGLSLLIAFVDGGFTETIGIIVAILLATGVSFLFEYDAMKRFEVLNTVNDDTPVKVRRNGEIMEVPRRDVVVGDLVLLDSGDEIPADGELVDAVSLKINESTLTGELSTSKTTDPKHFDKESTYPSNMVFRGTTTAEGHGSFIVSAVGDATEYGKVAEQSTVDSGEETPLNIQLTRLSKIIGKVGVGLAVAIFLILLGRDLLLGHFADAEILQVAGKVLQYFMVSVAILVMAVPEGLPMSITLSLAMNMRRMLKSNNLVRTMHASETMGAVTTICTDKTGTLTRNEMRVADMRLYQETPQEKLAEMIAANSTAFLDSEGNVIGNPTEGALLLWLKDHKIDYAKVRETIKQIDQITFSTERKYMATIAKGKDGKNRLYVKGAPEILLKMSTPNISKKEVVKQLSHYQNRAMRTLGFAVAETDSSSCKEAIERGDLQFIGVVAISDPVREDVPAAVAQCIDAGISIKIVTGDTTTTAREIARQIGLWDDSVDGELNEITGVEFEALSDEELLERVEGLKIMSRARPLDKQRLVRLLQQRGEVVAVTGDGTNDAPALNFAQVGLSMGSGTSVAKDASDITLLDDSFKSIATAVMWGRSLYKNIQRFVMFQLSVNFVALAIVFFGSIFGSGELPLTVVQILWVNIIMDTFAAIALASLPPESSVMKERPRKESDFIISRSMVKWIVGVGSVMVAVLMALIFKWGSSITPYQLSFFFTLFVMMLVWNLFNARAFGRGANESGGSLMQAKGFIAIFLVIFLSQILITSFGGEVFRTVPLNLMDWGTIILGSSLIAVGGAFARSLRKC